MRRSFSSWQSIVSVIMLMVLGFSIASAQSTETRRKVALNEGRKYMVAFPQVWASTTELATKEPLTLIITAKQKTVVTINTPAANNFNPRINRTVTVEPGKAFRLKVDLGYLPNQATPATDDGMLSENIQGNGIEVKADKPISVFTFQAWNGNGELARHLPVEAFGKEYSTANYYQDQYNDNGTEKLKPSQILLVSAYDGTQVTYNPTYQTQGGSDQSSVPAKAAGRVTLNKGETFLILAKTTPGFSQDNVTDLSGTVIKSSRPLGVISGHTKVAIPRMPYVLVGPGGGVPTPAHFIRNNVHDAQLPINMAGKEFVTLPSMYTDLRVPGKASQQTGSEDDRGDVIRVNALEDNTIIERMAQNGSGWQRVRSMKRGESFRVEEILIDATMWRADKPVLMTQYGKSWANIIPPVMGKTDGQGNTIGKGIEGTQGHPTVESGMPMMEYIPSTDRWASYGAFYSAEGMDNFFNIAFKTEEASKIKVDGRSLAGGFGGSMKKLQGTPYSYIRTKIATGDHTVESTEDGVRFAAWTYGSLDGLNQGRAYGTPISIDLAIACDDSLIVPGEPICGDVDAKGQILPLNTTCGSLFAIYADALNNYELIVDEAFSSGDMVGNFKVNVLNKEEDATATVLVVSRSGNVVEKTYTYLADKISFTPSSVDWGAIAIGTAVPNTEIKVKNLTNRPVNLNDIKAKTKPNNFKVISPAMPFLLAPNAEITLTVTATISSSQEQIDTLVAVLDCYEKNLSEVRARGEAPIIAVDDIDWGKLPSVSQGIRKDAFIYNRSGVELIVTGYDNSNLGADYASGKNFFAVVGLESFPIKIQAGEKYKFSVMYSPQGVAGTQHTLNVPFYSNAQKVDSISVLTGIGTQDVLSITNAEWNERVIDVVQTRQNINEYTAVIKFKNDGSAPATFQAPVIIGADAANFRIVNNGDVGTFPVQLPALQERYFTVAFTPTEVAGRGAERNYSAQVSLPNNSTAGTLTVAELKGIAWQPHVKGANIDFGKHNTGDAIVTRSADIANTSKDDVVAVSTGNAKGTHAVRITGINIIPNVDGKGTPADVALFTVRNAPSPTAPWFMQPEDAVRNLDVVFDPRMSGVFFASYEIITDQVDQTNGAAPYVPVYELKAEVEGSDFTVEGSSAEQYVYRTKNMTVKINNPESTTRRFNIGNVTGADASVFTVLDQFVDIPGNSSATINVVFSPDEISKVTGAQTGAATSGKNWVTDKGVAQGLKVRPNTYQVTLPITDAVTGLVKEATLTGEGLYLETTNFIGDQYRLAPGQNVDVAVQLRATPESIDNGDVTMLRVRIDGFAPRLVSPRFAPADIITAGTLTEGWTVVASTPAKDANGLVTGLTIDIEDQRANPVPLKSTITNDVVLKVKFDAFLGSSGNANSQFTTPINIRTNTMPSANPAAKSANHVLIQDYPGAITVDPKCAGVARLINVGAKTFAVKGISPNPTSNSATIQYSIGINCPANITLYNSVGTQVAELVNEYQQAGEYEVTLDVTNLSAGTYYYSVNAGPFQSAMQSVTVVK